MDKINLRRSRLYWVLILLGCVLIYLNHGWAKTEQLSYERAANMQGSMNTIYYFRHRHHEPTYSWLVVSGEHGPIEDTEKEVSDLEIKAQAWEVDHNVDRPR